MRVGARRSTELWSSIRRTIVAVYCLFHASSRNPSRIKLVVKDPSPPRLCEKWTNALISRLGKSTHREMYASRLDRGRIGGEPRDPRKGRSFSRTFRYPWNEKRSELWNLSTPFQVNDPGIRNIRPKLDRSENLSRRPRFEKKKKKKNRKIEIFRIVSLLSFPLPPSPVNVDLAIDPSCGVERLINSVQGRIDERHALVVSSFYIRALART